jgi:hypothetical protein
MQLSFPVFLISLAAKVLVSTVMAGQKWTIYLALTKKKLQRLPDFLSLFEDRLTRRQIQRLLDSLKSEGYIYFDGKPRSIYSFWKYKEK